MEGASGVIALVLAETAAGSAAVMWATGLWGRVKRGFFILTTGVALGCALLATFSAAVAHAPAEGGARSVVIWGAVASGTMGLSLASLILRALEPARLLGYAATAASAVMLLQLARLGERAVPLDFLELLVGALFMGAVTAGLLLGHWYLVDRGLPRDHIRRLAAFLIGAVAVETIVVALGGTRGDVEPSGGFGPLITATGGGVWLVLVLGMAGLTALLAGMIWLTLREPRPRAVQAATGFFYLAVITAFTAELAVKVYFLG